MNRLLLVEDSADGAVLQFVPRSACLDTANARVMADFLTALPDRQQAGHLVFDFAPVEFVSSEALGVLVGLYKRVAAMGGRLTLLNLRENVYEVFEVTNLIRILRVQREDGYGYLTNQGAVPSSEGNPCSR